MALTEKTEIGSMEVLPMGQIQVRTDTIIERDGVEISRTYHRHVVEPDSNISGEDQRVKDIANTVHTDACKKACADQKKSLGAQTMSTIIQSHDQTLADNNHASCRIVVICVGNDAIE